MLDGAAGAGALCACLSCNLPPLYVSTRDTPPTTTTNTHTCTLIHFYGDAAPTDICFELED